MAFSVPSKLSLRRGDVHIPYEQVDYGLVRLGCESLLKEAILLGVWKFGIGL